MEDILDLPLNGLKLGFCHLYFWFWWKEPWSRVKFRVTVLVQSLIYMIKDPHILPHVMTPSYILLHCSSCERKTAAYVLWKTEEPLEPLADESLTNSGSRLAPARMGALCVLYGLGWEADCDLWSQLCKDWHEILSSKSIYWNLQHKHMFLRESRNSFPQFIYLPG